MHNVHKDQVQSVPLTDQILSALVASRQSNLVLAITTLLDYRMGRAAETLLFT